MSIRMSTFEEFLKKNVGTEFIVEYSSGNEYKTGSDILKNMGSIRVITENRPISHYRGWAVGVMLKGEDNHLHFINGGNQIIRSNIRIASSYVSGNI